MPYKSKAQEAWAHTPEGRKAMGDKLTEWDASSKGLTDLPEHVTKQKVKKSILKKLKKNRIA